MGDMKRASFLKFVYPLVGRSGFWLYCGLLTIFLYRVSGLNYNAAFADEAIYIVLGKLGVFQWDWWSFNASNWLAGSMYGYPVIAALAFQAGGLVAVRFLSVVVSILLLELVYHIIGYVTPTRRRHLAGMLTVLIIGVSSIGYHVSRLATYDIFSIYGLFLAIYCLLRARVEPSFPAKWYLVGSVCLVLATMMKVTVVLFIPFLLLIGWLSNRRVAQQRRMYFWYFFVPLTAGLLILGILSGEGLVHYLTSQQSREYVTIGVLIAYMYERLAWMLWMTAAATVVMVWRGKSLYAALFIGAAGVLPLTHILTHRMATFEKHLYIPIIFLAMLIGLAMDEIWSSYKGLKSYILGGLIGVILLIGGVDEIEGSRKYNSYWEDTRRVEAYMASTATGQAPILTQQGPTIMLSLYDRVHPLNITTFDWIDYQGAGGTAGYSKAIADGYFELIEIGSKLPEQESMHMNTYQTVIKDLDEAYELAYQDEVSLVYKRRY
jgi:hypothetical protein